MREDLFYAIAGVGAWYNDSPMRKLEPLKIEEAVIVGVINRGFKDLHIGKGDRFVQGLFTKYYLAKEDENNKSEE